VSRLLTSRKLWGALIGSVCILVAGKFIDITVAATAITALGALWGAAITGQAAYDYVKGKAGENKD
jgi:hypothetical protein